MGKNATVLHYTHNNCLCKKGEILLVDAGAEYNYYSSDITRVYPVSGKFSKSQKQIYERLLKLQKSLIKEVKPGVSLKHLHKKMCEGITHMALEFHLLKGSFKETFKKRAYKKYCPHFIGHPLGLDVHDNSFQRKENPVLTPGMILTIEPGFYISNQDNHAKEDLKGLGIRIEDDILVTATGYENLTKNMPKEISAIEQLLPAITPNFMWMLMNQLSERTLKKVSGKKTGKNFFYKKREEKRCLRKVISKKN